MGNLGVAAGGLQQVDSILILIGVACVICAIVGGGVKMSQLELGQVPSIKRQLILAFFGIVLIIVGAASRVDTSKFFPRATPSPTKAETATVASEVDRDRSIIAEKEAEVVTAPERISPAPTKASVPTRKLEKSAPTLERYKEVMVEQAEKAVAIPVEDTSYDKSGWIFLGTYDLENSRWVSIYWKTESSPTSLVNKVITAKSPVNVRESSPSSLPNATFGRIITSIPENTRVRVKEVTDWEESGYMWARVDY